MTIRKFLFTVCFVFILTPLWAQPGSAPFPVGPSVPVDGAGGLLLAAGALYGAYRIRQKNKAAEEEK